MSKNFLDESGTHVLWSPKLMGFQASLNLQGLSTVVDVQLVNPVVTLENVSWDWEINPVFHTFI